ncbi:MAG: type II secretion system protein N [Reinekea sp.]|nr:type II secretion system protein N [Reinekea sp.]
MKLVNIKILALLVISYSIALVAMTPLSWLLPYVQPQLAAVGVQLTDVEGSIWQGEGVLTERNVGSAQVKWDVNAIQIPLLRLPIDLHVTNNAADVHAIVTLTPFNLSVDNLNGYVDEVLFKSVYQTYRADIKGRLQLDNVHAKLSWNKSLGDASGALSWSGGPVSLPVGRSTQTFEVPTMFGQITSSDNQWGVNIAGANQQQYITAQLDGTGVATLSVKRVLATEMKISVPGNGSSLLDISQQVF